MANWSSLGEFREYVSWALCIRLNLCKDSIQKPYSVVVEIFHVNSRVAFRSTEDNITGIHVPDHSAYCLYGPTLRPSQSHLFPFIVGYYFILSFYSDDKPSVHYAGQQRRMRFSSLHRTWILLNSKLMVAGYFVFCPNSPSQFRKISAINKSERIFFIVPP